ncbi:MAG TPA: phage integrase N-terminal domain-containing protein, partial [Terracidiphilus sp.]|nr:phage integrase N-terminal domain-containing protein [Terracidiphilus sp.]
MTRKNGAGGSVAGASGGWKGTLGARRDGAVASFATQDNRADVLYAGFRRLRELGFRMETVTSLRGRHVEALAKDWHARGFSASSLHNNLSIFRSFVEWIGKAGMVRDIGHYLGPGTTARSSIAREDKSWSRNGVDVPAKIEQVRE